MRISSQSSLSSSLYRGQVYHKRLRPKVHALKYQVFSLLLSLDEIDELTERLWLFSRNRWNLFSFYDKDFGDSESGKHATGYAEANECETLKQYVFRKLETAGIAEKPDRIMLSCYPRVCGYAFNPLSLFYCFDANGRAFAILHEVHNTFGERHTYVLPVTDSSDEGDHDANALIQQNASKALFVSPFAHMNMRYRFQLNVPDEKQLVVIQAFDEAGHLLTASYSAQRETLSAVQLSKCFIRLPFMTVKVIGGIHWEAMKLWIKRVPWFSHQPKQSFSRNRIKNS